VLRENLVEEFERAAPGILRGRRRRTTVDIGDDRVALRRIEVRRFEHPRIEFARRAVDLEQLGLYEAVGGERLRLCEEHRRPGKRRAEPVRRRRLQIAIDPQIVARVRGQRELVRTAALR
jgi:hypothetical protein